MLNMFGDLFNIKEKIDKAKREVLETRERLDRIYVDKASPCGAVRVSVTANKQIHDLAVDPSAFEDARALAETVKTTLNKALEEAGKIQETELKNAFLKHMPDIPGLENLL